MEISRNVILDLLPMYFANELSEDSRTLVEKHLEDDPQLAKLARKSEAMALSEKIPVPLTQNGELMAYRKAKRVIMWRTIAVAVAIAIFLLLVMTMFFYSDPPSDTSDSTADGVVRVRTPLGLAMEDLEDRCEISRSRGEASDFYTAEHVPGAHNVCLQMLQHESGYTVDNCITKKILSEGKMTV